MELKKLNISSLFVDLLFDESENKFKFKIFVSKDDEVIYKNNKKVRRL